MDGNKAAAARAPAVETGVRTRITSRLERRPTPGVEFAGFGTSPVVLMFDTPRPGYPRISGFEETLLPAEVFSPVEASAGRMVEAVVRPKYGREFAPGGRPAANSATDGKKGTGDTICLATLTSGFRCPNDGTSEHFADALLANFKAWTEKAGQTELNSTHGVLYGTRKQPNKKY